MFDNPLFEWSVREEDFPSSGTPEEKLRFLIRYAILAPSSHNTQPWLFRVSGNQLVLMADRTRGLAVVDPHDRALVISCGAALGILRAAMHHFGYSGSFQLLPNPADPDVLARVSLGEVHVPDGGDHRRFHAIQRRRSTRLKYADEQLPAGLADKLVALAADDNVELRVVAEIGAKAKIAALVAKGDREQFANASFRRELASWVHSRRRKSRDGISGSNFGMPDLLSAVGSVVIRTFDMGDGVGAKDKDIAMHSPALLVFGTNSDVAEDWLRVGMAHVTVLMEVTASGFTSAYLNQPIEVDRLRSKLKATAAISGLPQLLLRMGRAPEIPPAVRRHLEDVLLA